eukprot:8966407-Alexandrium_andersonii.AAC.1
MVPIVVWRPGCFAMRMVNITCVRGCCDAAKQRVACDRASLHAYRCVFIVVHIIGLMVCEHVPPPVACA